MIYILTFDHYSNQRFCSGRSDQHTTCSLHLSFDFSDSFYDFRIILVFIFILNHLVIKKNIQPEIKEVDLQRIEMKKRVKAGEISLDDLTIPVFESEEEREKRLEEEAKSKQLVLDAKGGEVRE